MVVRKNPVHVAFFVLCAYVIVALCAARMLLTSKVVVRKNPVHVAFFVLCAYVIGHCALRICSSLQKWW